MDGMTIAFAIIAVIAFAVIIYGTIRKNRFGLNFSRPNCPTCGVQVPRMRRPTSGRQAAWGGWTCSNCGTEMDKWGRAISGPTREFRASL